MFGLLMSPQERLCVSGVQGGLEFILMRIPMGMTWELFASFQSEVIYVMKSSIVKLLESETKDSQSEIQPCINQWMEDMAKCCASVSGCSWIWGLAEISCSSWLWGIREPFLWMVPVRTVWEWLSQTASPSLQKRSHLISLHSRNAALVAESKIVQPRWIAAASPTPSHSGPSLVCIN